MTSWKDPSVAHDAQQTSKRIIVGCICTSPDIPEDVAHKNAAQKETSQKMLLQVTLALLIGQRVVCKSPTQQIGMVDLYAGWYGGAVGTQQIPS
jgi:hypothetical protein